MADSEHGGTGAEEFRVLYLNNQNQLIAGETLFTGTINRTEVHPREVIKRALYHNAAAVVLAHNHPSGEVTPVRQTALSRNVWYRHWPGGYPGTGPSDSRWQPGFLLCGTRSALTRHRTTISHLFSLFIFCLQRYPIMKIITRGEAMRIHRQHPASRLFRSVYR